MKTSVTWMAKNHVAANLLMVFVLLSGFIAMMSLKRETFPEIAVAIQTRQAARLVMHRQRKHALHMAHEGALDEEHAAAFVAAVERAMKGLFFSPPRVKLPEPEDVLREVTWLAGVDEPVFAAVKAAAQKHHYSQGVGHNALQ